MDEGARALFGSERGKALDWAALATAVEASELYRFHRSSALAVHITGLSILRGVDEEIAPGGSDDSKQYTVRGVVTALLTACFAYALISGENDLQDRSLDLIKKATALVKLEANSE
jgi:hypothetical protein